VKVANIMHVLNHDNQRNYVAFKLKVDYINNAFSLFNNSEIEFVSSRFRLFLENRAMEQGSLGGRSTGILSTKAPSLSPHDPCE